MLSQKRYKLQNDYIETGWNLATGKTIATMKILNIFIDMLRADKLYHIDDDVSTKSPLDNLFEDLGGTIFCNCFTPAPDTPRSLATYFTGLYPKYNGCDLRTKWPTFFLDESNANVFDYFENKGFDIITRFDNVNINRSLPPNSGEYVKNYSELDRFVNRISNLDQSDDVYSFVSLKDYHYFVDDLYGHPKADELGNKYVTNIIQNNILTETILNEFDYIFMFTDHGCKLNDDDESKIESINRNRSQILMFVSRSNDKSLKKNDTLTSSMDYFPTIASIFGDKVNSNGYPLFDNTENRKIMIEDHNRFKPELGTYHDIWGVKTSDLFYVETLDDVYLYDSEHHHLSPRDYDLDKFSRLIEEHSTMRETIRKQHGYLNDPELTATSDYSDGTPRPSDLILRFNKIRSRLNRRLTKLN